jgi:NTE family protein
LLGLVLEGGGAKGAFHMGAVKAFLEAGYKFDGVSGTSIGALNGAVIVQGDFETGYKLWETMDNTIIYDIDKQQLEKIINSKFDKEILYYLSSRIKEVINNKGLDTKKIRELLNQVINEEKIRQSAIDFGIVTVSLSDFKPLEIYKEDIPKGKLVDYLMASASFPAFKLEPIADKFYIDGGFYDNCPVNLLVRKGYSEIIAVRTLGIGFNRKIEDKDVKVTNIIPSENLGMILNFDHEQIKTNLKMGYYDAMRVIKHLKGKKYYIEAVNEDLFFHNILALPEEVVYKMGSILVLPKMEPKRMLFEKIFPALARTLKLQHNATYQDIIVETIEHVALEQGIDRFQLFKFSEFLKEVQKANAKRGREREPLFPSLTVKKKLSAVFSADAVVKEAGYQLLSVLQPEQYVS